MSCWQISGARFERGYDTLKICMYTKGDADTVINIGTFGALAMINMGPSVLQASMAMAMVNA